MVVRVSMLSGLLLLATSCSNGDPSDGSLTSTVASIAAEGMPNSATPMADGEARKRRAAMLADMAKGDRIEDPPVVDLVRWTSPDEFLPALAACMNEAGFAMKADGTLEVPSSQTAALRRQGYICTAKYTVHPYYNEPLSRAAAGRQYDWTIKTQLPCIRTHGVTVSDPPSREVYIDSVVRGSVDTWNPSLLADQSADRETRAKLRTECPAQAPASLIYEFDPAGKGGR